MNSTGSSRSGRHSPPWTGATHLPTGTARGRRLNCPGIGIRVAAYTAGRTGEAAALLGAQEIAVGFGYTSGHAASAHFELDTVGRCDIVLTLPPGSARTPHDTFGETGCSS